MQYKSILSFLCFQRAPLLNSRLPYVLSGLMLCLWRFLDFCRRRVQLLIGTYNRVALKMLDSIPTVSSWRNPSQPMKPVSASDICRPASAYCPKERIKSERVRFFTAAEGGPLVLPVTFQHRSYQHSVLPWLRPAHCVLWTHILGMFCRQGSFVRYTRRGPHFISSCLLLVASFLPLFCRLFFLLLIKHFGFGT